ncbi:hypothetical protein P4H27_10030 [Paenibacillus taichungensis]|uniref:hypothetical protein n=1 Tax=Paenibacillus taichungensis TaxID=484184 RepID=UPI002DB91163|nr:hypothetical protein [Paenibacillus taichungensis]MEC0107274.1 hypothetical protein [Paenibacillus taichungensis]MEC0194794.1 hypothetical protein [Paenibacillus taichungensis]
MDIVFSANNFAEMRKIPILPNELSIESPQNNEEFETIERGTVSLIGLPGLRSLSIESFFPNRTYSFAKDKRLAPSYIQFFDKWRAKRVPLRVIITDSKQKEILNMACTIDTFSYGVDRSGDFPYILSVKEFKLLKVK